MALSKLSGDEQWIILTKLCDPLDPGIAVALSSINKDLRTAMQRNHQLQLGNQRLVTIAQPSQLMNPCLSSKSFCTNRRAMALSKLSGDEQCIILTKLCNPLDTGIAVALSSINTELRAATRAPLQQLQADHEAAAALCRKLENDRGVLRNCKALREAKRVYCYNGLTVDELKLLGTLGSVLPALKTLSGASSPLAQEAGPEGMRQLAAGLGAGALPALTHLFINCTHVGDAASALAAALGKGALLRLGYLELTNTAIGDAALVALAPALRRLPALWWLSLSGNPLGDEGLAALVAPPQPADAPPPTTGGLTKLKQLSLSSTQITNAGCAVLATALDSGALPALKSIGSLDVPLASAAAIDAVHEALANLRGVDSESGDVESVSESESWAEESGLEDVESESEDEESDS